jgi:hypothetical protein
MRKLFSKSEILKHHVFGTVVKITCQEMALPYDRSPQSWGHTSPQISLARTALYKERKSIKTTANIKRIVSQDKYFFVGI